MVVPLLSRIAREAIESGALSRARHLILREGRGIGTVSTLLRQFPGLTRAEAGGIFSRASQSINAGRQLTGIDGGVRHRVKDVPLVRNSDLRGGRTERFRYTVNLRAELADAPGLTQNRTIHIDSNSPMSLNEIRAEVESRFREGGESPRGIIAGGPPFTEWTTVTTIEAVERRF